jgi:hypothetical protein
LYTHYLATSSFSTTMTRLIFCEYERFDAWRLILRLYIEVSGISPNQKCRTAEELEAQESLKYALRLAKEYATRACRQYHAVFYENGKNTTITYKTDTNMPGLVLMRVSCILLLTTIGDVN